jgi:hypothetical protein
VTFPDDFPMGEPCANCGEMDLDCTCDDEGTMSLARDLKNVVESEVADAWMPCTKADAQTVLDLLAAAKQARDLLWDKEGLAIALVLPDLQAAIKRMEEPT